MFSWMRVRGVTERRYCKSATNYQFLLFTPLGPRPCDWWRNSTGVTQDGVTTHHAVPVPVVRRNFTPQSQSEFSASHNLGHAQARMEISGRGERQICWPSTQDDFTFTTLLQGSRNGKYLPAEFVIRSVQMSGEKPLNTSPHP